MQNHAALYSVNADTTLSIVAEGKLLTGPMCRDVYVFLIFIYFSPSLFLYLSLPYDVLSIG